MSGRSWCFCHWCCQISGLSSLWIPPLSRRSHVSATRAALTWTDSTPASTVSSSPASPRNTSTITPRAKDITWVRHCFHLNRFDIVLVLWPGLFQICSVCSSSLFFSQLFVHTGYTFFCVLFLMTFKPWVDPMFPLLPVYHPLFIQLTDMCLLWLDICVHVPHSRQQPELWLALTLLCVCVKYSRIIDCSSFQDRFQMACNLHHSLKVLW